MFCRQLVRQSLSNAVRFYATEQSPLAALRKKTGYSLINCKKALNLHDNDVAKVIGWYLIRNTRNIKIIIFVRRNGG